MNKGWKRSEIGFEIEDDGTDDPVLSVTIITPAGRISAMASTVIMDRLLILHGLQMQGLKANAIGASNLRMIAQALMERFDYDGTIIEGAPRTTGANPGDRPRRLRFSRKHGDPA